jgi:hypothetical protein
VLTQLRKQRGKRVPEGLTTIDEMRNFRCSATHTVRQIVNHYFNIDFIFLTGIT